MSEASPKGLIAEFDRPEALIEAARAAQQAGYTHLDAFSPFPLRQLEDALGCKASALPYIAFAAALIGGILQYYAQYWMNAVDYPLNVGGRPLHSWPAFVPGPLIVSILWAGIATFVAMLWAMGLPRPHHPVFAVADFERASQDRFFLWIMAEDPRFERDDTLRFLTTFDPSAIREVPG
jgi:Protein of unknown function (DUF3341)